MTDGVRSGRVAECIILTGGLQPSPLQRMCPCSVLSLAIERGVTVLDHMLRRITEAAPGERPPLVKVVYGHSVPAPAKPKDTLGLDVTIMPESRRWRGPAGTLLDLCESVASTDSLLVLEGNRWFGSSLAGMVTDHVASGADITLAQSADRSPAGAYMIRRAALDLVPRNGFLDLKEQLIDKLLKDERIVRVWTLDPPGSLALWSLESFVHVAKAASNGGEDWNIIEPGAHVHATATLIDSVVMHDATIGEDAIVARSIVLPGAAVGAGTEIVDAVAHGGGVVQVEDPIRLAPVRRRTA